MKLKHAGKMTIAAHRGDCYNWYENTMTAFEKAIQAGADMIETDVRVSKDNILFLMHGCLNTYIKNTEKNLCCTVFIHIVLCVMSP